MGNVEILLLGRTGNTRRVASTSAARGRTSASQKNQSSNWYASKSARIPHFASLSQKQCCEGRQIWLQIFPTSYACQRNDYQASSSPEAGSVSLADELRRHFPESSTIPFGGGELAKWVRTLRLEVRDLDIFLHIVLHKVPLVEKNVLRSAS